MRSIRLMFTLPIALGCLSCQSKVVDDVTFLMSDQREAQYWRSVNDNVMGGVSTGAILFDQQQAQFSGKISLENNGGFSSVTRKIEPLPAHVKQVTIDVEGDGKLYQLRLNTLIQGYRLGYRHRFQTEAGKRLRITVPIAHFVATFRGRRLPQAPRLSPELISEFGFLITSKKAEAFKLNIYQISFN